MAGFEDLWVLVFLVVVPIGIYLYNKSISKKKKEAIKFSHLGFIKSALGNKKKSKRGRVLFYISIAILVCLIIGFANPHIPLKQSKEGVNIVLVLDISGSMKAQDYTPNRIESAKKSATILVKSLKSADHVGVISFESGATTSAYLSPYKDRVIEKIKSIKAKDGATAIGDGLAMGIDMAASISNKKNVVILLSDGVSNAGVISPDEAIMFARNNNMQVHTVGLGSKEPVILGYGWNGQPQYAELDEMTLKRIAQGTGGKYFKSVDSETLENIYKNIGDEIEREKEEVNIKEWFFFLALLLVCLELYLRYGKGKIIQ